MLVCSIPLFLSPAIKIAFAWLWFFKRGKISSTIFFIHRHARAKKSRVFPCQSHVHKAFLRDPQNMKVCTMQKLFVIQNNFPFCSEAQKAIIAGNIATCIVFSMYLPTYVGTY